MAFGIDSATTLNNSCFNWGNFNKWKGNWPTFVGRYFGNLTSAYDPAILTEFYDFNTTTGHTCKYVVPICAPTQNRLEQSKSTGYSYGASDAAVTISAINSFLKNGELVQPSSDQVYVYLDVEAGTILTPDYWAGWANSIYSAVNGQGLQIFYPAIYTQFVSSSSLYVPNSYVSNALNTACSDYPSQIVECFGFWSNEPEPLSGCTGSIPSWPSFETFQQNLCGRGDVSVPVYLWQYSENCGCLQNSYTGFGGQSNCTGFSNCGSNSYSTNNIDVDSSNNGAESYMLVIG